MARQRLDAYEETGGTLTTFPAKKLTYYNTQPTVEITYFHDAGKAEKDKDVFSSLTKEMLQKNQFRLSLLGKADKTSLNKNDVNGSQNIIDPYNNFLYPLDNFVAGSQDSALLAGNSSSSFSNVEPQNFFKLETALRYGLTDTLNSALKFGYQFGSAVHQYVFDLNITNRFYIFEPYYYVQWGTDWKVGKEGLLSLALYYVPKYKTFMTYDVANSTEFEEETQYLRAQVVFKKLF